VDEEVKGHTYRPLRVAYQPPASSSFLSEQTSHQQPASSTFLLEQINTCHKPPAKRTGCIPLIVLMQGNETFQLILLQATCTLPL
jgi:hypothetical protein